MHFFLSVLLALTCCLLPRTAMAQSTSAPQSPASENPGTGTAETPPAADARPGDTVEDTRSLDDIAIPDSLPERHRTWIEHHRVLLIPRELDVFVGLDKEYQRDAFIRRFWKVRDPFPATARNEFQDRYEANLELARSRYDNLGDARAQAVLLHGEPSNVLEIRCADYLHPLQLWYYERTMQITGSFYLVFYKPTGGPHGPYELWQPRDGFYQLLSTTIGAIPEDAVILSTISDSCFRGADIVDALARSIDWEYVNTQINIPPKPSDEWLRTFVAFSTDLPTGAELFEANVELSYPGRFQSRSLLQGIISVPRAHVATSDLTKTPTYNFVLDGEILRDGELFEHFRYRFHLPQTGDGAPPAEAGRELPLIFQRYLRPGDYSLVLKLQDLGSNRYYRHTRDLEVPRVATRTVAAPELVPDAAQAAASGADPGGVNHSAINQSIGARLLSEANQDLTTGDQSVRLLVPFGGLLVGRVRVDAVVDGPDVDRVRFFLNDRAVFAKRRPPFSVELNLGDSPRIHTLRAVALDEAGKELAADEVLVNAGPHRFGVRLIEPRRGGRYSRSLRAQALVDVPEGEELERLEFYLNETLVATLYQPPFVQPLLVPEEQAMTYVRVTAYLRDGNSAEDAVFVNAPDYVDEVDVQFVELYSSILDRGGEPIEDVEQQELKVLENGVEQQIRRFAKVDDVPIHAGLVMDVSRSMEYRLEDAVRGALRFFEDVITPKDRAAVITFNEEPHLAVRFTNDLDVLAGGVAGLTAEGETALYDSLVYALYYFSGISGKRAIILLSDGEDVRSRYTFEDVITYARHTGVAVYTVGIDLSGSSRTANIQLSLRQLADETGGRAFLIQDSRELIDVYERIQTELRSQYLITYQSSLDDEGFREVEVQVDRPRAEVRTLRGYFP